MVHPYTKERVLLYSKPIIDNKNLCTLHWDDNTKLFWLQKYRNGNLQISTMTDIIFDKNNCVEIPSYFKNVDDPIIIYILNPPVGARIKIHNNVSMIIGTYVSMDSLNDSDKLTTKVTLLDPLYKKLTIVGLVELECHSGNEYINELIVNDAYYIRSMKQFIGSVHCVINKTFHSGSSYLNKYSWVDIFSREESLDENNSRIITPIVIADNDINVSTDGNLIVAIKPRKNRITLCKCATIDIVSELKNYALIVPVTGEDNGMVIYRILGI